MSRPPRRPPPSPPTPLSRPPPHPHAAAPRVRGHACRSRAWGRPHRPRQARHAGGAGAQGRSVGQSRTLAVASSLGSTHTVGAHLLRPYLFFPAVSVLRGAG